MIDPFEAGSAEVWLEQGLDLMAKRRFAEAVAPLERAVAHPDAPSLWRTCLAQALFLTGDFARSVVQFEAARAQEALAPNAAATLAQARCLRDLALANGSGDVEAVLSRYGKDADLEEAALHAFADDAAKILAGFEYGAAAAIVGRWRLRSGEADAVARYQQAVLDGVVFERAPADYVEQHFDAFADRFDHQLVDMLGYDAPAQLGRLVAAHRDCFGAVADLGCGTGLAGPILRPMAQALTGVDLSAGMLAKARARGGYDQLIQSEVVAFLRASPKAFDLIFAADVLIYFGDLAAFIDAAVAALAPDGLLAVTTEQAAEGWALLASGRFAHADAYLDGLADGRLARLSLEHGTLRTEGVRSVAGGYHLFRSRT